jgi:hypothetical protein
MNPKVVELAHLLDSSINPGACALTTEVLDLRVCAAN